MKKIVLLIIGILFITSMTSCSGQKEPLTLDGILICENIYSYNGKNYTAKEVFEEVKNNVDKKICLSIDNNKKYYSLIAYNIDNENNVTTEKYIYEYSYFNKDYYNLVYDYLEFIHINSSKNDEYKIEYKFAAKRML